MKFLNTDAIHESGTLLYNKPVKENYKITTAPCPVFKNDTHIDFTNYATYTETGKEHNFNFQKVEFYYEPTIDIDPENVNDYPEVDEFSSEDGIVVKVYKLIGIIGTNLFGEQTIESNISQLCLYRAFELISNDEELENKDRYNITYYLYSYYSKGNLDYSKRYYLGENIPSGKYEVSYSSLTLNDKSIKGEAVKVDTTDIKYTTTQKYPIFGHSTNCASGKYYELKIYKSDNECPIYLPMQEGSADDKSTNQLFVNVNYSDTSVVIGDAGKYCHTINNLDSWSTQLYCMYNTIHGYTTNITDGTLKTIKYFPVTNNDYINKFALGGVKHNALKTGINNFENSVLVPNSGGYKVSTDDYVNEVAIDIGSSVTLNKNELYKFTATLEITDSTLIGLLDSDTLPNPIFDIEFVLKLSGTNIKLIEFDNNCLKSTNANSSYTIDVAKYFTVPTNPSSVKLECSNIVYKYITDENVITGTSLLNTGFTITDIKLYKLTSKNETLSGTFYTKYAYNTDTKYIGQDTFTLYDNDIHDSEVYREWHYYLDESKFENNYTNIEITPLATTGTLTCTVTPSYWTSTTKNSTKTFTATTTFIDGDDRIKLFNYEWNFKSGDNVLKNLMPTGENKKKNKLTITRKRNDVDHLKGGKATITCTSTLNPDYGLTTISPSMCDVDIVWSKIASSITASKQSINGVTNTNKRIYIGKNYTGTFTITTTYPLSNLNNNPISIDSDKTNINFVQDTLSFSITDPNSWAASGTYIVSYTFTMNSNTDITVSPAIYIKATDQNSPFKTEVLQCSPNNLSINKYDLTVSNNTNIENDISLDLYKTDGKTKTLTFECTTNTDLVNTDVDYQWYKNGQVIEGATNSTYIINSVDLKSGTYKYYCIASNIYSNSQKSGTVTCRIITDNNSIVTVGSAFSPVKTINEKNYYIPDNDTVRYKHYDDVQEAINNVGSGEVWIGTKDTYKHGSEMKMKNNVAIYGGFAGTERSKEERVSGNNTILDGEGKYRVFDNACTSSNPLTNSAKLDNVTIQNGYTTGDGAGMYNVYASPEITNCTFSGNIASGGGGMFNSWQSSPEITNCTFSGNIASSYSSGGGGGMCNTSVSSPKLTNCTFSGNSAKHEGGGMYNRSSSPKLTNCTFNDNKSNDVSSTESGNNGNGGAISNNMSNTTINTCTFTNNQALNHGDGGAITSYGNNSLITLQNCIFTENIATDTGGAIANHTESTLQLYYCTFDGNTAVSGGAIENWTDNTETTTLSAEYCYFVGNKATIGTVENSLLGGAIVSEGLGTVNNITSCTFDGNTAVSGGAIYSCDNKSKNIAGAYSNTTLTNCTFDGNTAVSGGAVENKGSKLKVYYCTFTNNIVDSTKSEEVTGAAIKDNHPEDSTVLKNCILWNNKKDSNAYSHGYYSNSDSNIIDITYCVIQPSSNTSEDNNITTDPDRHIITTDPKLQPLANNGGYVQTCKVVEGSSAIGAGMVIEDITNDARGYIRSTTAPTIGAFEYNGTLPS